MFSMALHVRIEYFREYMAQCSQEELMFVENARRRKKEERYDLSSLFVSY